VTAAFVKELEQPPRTSDIIIIGDVRPRYRRRLAESFKGSDEFGVTLFEPLRPSFRSKRAL